MDKLHAFLQKHFKYWAILNRHPCEHNCKRIGWSYQIGPFVLQLPEVGDE